MKRNKALFYSLIVIVFVMFLWLGFFIVPSLSEYQPGEETKQHKIGSANSFTYSIE